MHEEPSLPDCLEPSREDIFGQIVRRLNSREHRGEFPTREELSSYLFEDVPLRLWQDAVQRFIKAYPAARSTIEEMLLEKGCDLSFLTMGVDEFLDHEAKCERLRDHIVSERELSGSMYDLPESSPDWDDRTPEQIRASYGVLPSHDCGTTYIIEGC